MRAILALLVSTCLASAQEAGPIVSCHGVGHDSWHTQFYSKLTKDDGGSCCNFNDCRPTLSRSVGNHYEVLVDGEWTAVPLDTISVGVNFFSSILDRLLSILDSP